jgi:hypothetical protein
MGRGWQRGHVRGALLRAHAPALLCNPILIKASRAGLVRLMVGVGETARLVRRRQGSQVCPDPVCWPPAPSCACDHKALWVPASCHVESASLCQLSRQVWLLQRTRFASPGAGWPAVLRLTRPCGRIWGQDGGRWVCESILEDAHDRTVRAAAWSPGDDKLATASFDGTCVVWSCRDGEYEQVATLQGHENEVCCTSRLCLMSAAVAAARTLARSAVCRCNFRLGRVGVWRLIGARAGCRSSQWRGMRRATCSPPAAATRVCGCGKTSTERMTTSVWLCFTAIRRFDCAVGCGLLCEPPALAPPALVVCAWCSLVTSCPGCEDGGVASKQGGAGVGIVR